MEDSGWYVLLPPMLQYLECSGFPTEASRIEARISEGEAKRSKRDNLEFLLAKKITSVRYPMQELELNYPTTKGKVYSEEEDRYLLCRLWHYGMHMDDAYERIKKDITEFPVFRFDWFFKSRSPQELQRRCNTLLGMIEKEEELRQFEEEAKSKPKGKVCVGRGLPEMCDLYGFFRLILETSEGIDTCWNWFSETSIKEEKGFFEVDSLDSFTTWR